VTLVRVAVLGAGPWGANHVRVAAHEPRCELAMVVDRDPAALERAKAIAPQAQLRGSVDAALADPTIEAVIIAMPAATHAALTCAALAAGKHVLVEKPLALTLADAHQIAAAADRAKRVCLVGHLLVFHPAVERMREIVASGELGAIHTIRATRANMGRHRRDENVLWSFGPHDLSMLDFILGAQPVTVSARGQCVHEAGIEDVVFVTLRYAEAMAHLHLSRHHPRKERVLTLVGSQQTAELDDVSDEKLRIYGASGVHIPALPVVEPLQLQLQHFLACVAGEVRPRADVASGLRGLTVLEAAQRSLVLDGAPVAVQPAGTP
jgi:predicted dehydrogenase